MVNVHAFISDMHIKITNFLPRGPQLDDDILERALRIHSTELSLVVLDELLSLCLDQVQAFLFNKRGHVVGTVGLWRG